MEDIWKIKIHLPSLESLIKTNVTEDFMEDGREFDFFLNLKNSFLKLLSRHCKIGDMFIMMPTKGRSDAFHNSK